VCATDHGDPANRPVDSAECCEDLQRRRHIELEPAMALRHKHAKDANRSQRFHQVGRHSRPASIFAAREVMLGANSRILASRPVGRQRVLFFLIEGPIYSFGLLLKNLYLSFS
jgi:hypothetical protein